jgi:hypothetical protein
MFKICSKCEIEKPINEFSVRNDIQDGGYRKACISCENIRHSEYRKTLRGFLLKLLKDARKDAKYRLDKGRIEAGLYDITYNDIEALWKNQNGLCYYRVASRVRFAHTSRQ